MTTITINISEMKTEHLTDVAHALVQDGFKARHRGVMMYRLDAAKAALAELSDRADFSDKNRDELGRLVRHLGYEDKAKKDRM